MCSMGSAPQVRPRDRVKVTCECGHKRVNHNPRGVCTMDDCGCKAFEPWVETLYRDYDWQGMKAALSVTNHVRHVRRPE